MELCEQHPAYGFGLMYHTLRKKGYRWNHKRVYRVYCKMGLNMRRRVKRRLPARIRTPLEVPLRANEVWSMDFVSDTLYDGRKIRVLNILDDYHREAVAMEVDTSITALRVTRVLQSLKEDGLKPKQIRVDNGPEFISKTFVDWCNNQQIEIRYIQPGKPVQNAFIERFNGTYRREILDAYLFHTLNDVKQITYEWMEYYNHKRPHNSLHNLSPMEYLSIHTST
jgi:putative transposase